jgi:hypothetical protein
MWPLGAGEQNPASSPVLAAEEGRGKGLGLLGARFGVLDWAERWPVSGSPAAREERPWWLLFRRGGGLGEWRSKPVSLCGC